MSARCVLLLSGSTVENLGQSLSAEAKSLVAARWGRYPPVEASTLRGERTQHGSLHVDSGASLNERKPAQLSEGHHPIVKEGSPKGFV